MATPPFLFEEKKFEEKEFLFELPFLFEEKKFVFVTYILTLCYRRPRKLIYYPMFKTCYNERLRTIQ